MLDLRVIGRASEKGTLELLKKARGEKKMLAAIIECMKENGYSDEKVMIHFCQSKTVAEKLKDMIISEFTDAQVEISEARGLCAFYAESGGLLVGYEA